MTGFLPEFVDGKRTDPWFAPSSRQSGRYDNVALQALSFILCWRLHPSFFSHGKGVSGNAMAGITD